MASKITNEIWDYLKEEYIGDEIVRSTWVLNSMREFEFEKDERVLYSQELRLSK